MPAIHQVLATLGYGDAIGNEVLGIQRVLRNAGYQSEIFVQTVDPRLEDLTLDYRDLPEASHPDNILIHHFSIGSRASRMAYALPDRMALIYHNITPPEYFVDINKELVRLCFRGRRELALYQSRCDLALGDSEYNKQELEALGFSPAGVLQVVPGFDHLEGPPDYTFAGAFDDDWVNVLFVGRVIPNKRFEDVIRAFHAYQTYFNPRSRLLLVGAHAGFERYLTLLHEFTARIGARDVHLVGHVSNEELTAYYELADIFVCASEHEGFCVPLIESFHMGVPVLAYAATAVPSTMDGAGVLYTTKDPMYLAALINAVVDDRQLADRIIDGQYAALERLEAKDFAGTLLRHVDRLLASPRKPHPPVAFDFWDQVERAEELDEIKAYRPSAFLALPPESGSGSREPGTVGAFPDPGSRLPVPDKQQP
jgi:L-malate glycosyltransferase